MKPVLPVFIGLSLIASCGAGPSAGSPSSAPSSAPPTGEVGAGVPKFWVRPGYRVDLAGDKISGARFLEVDDKGIVYVSRPNQGDILTFRYENGKLKPLGTFISGKSSVHGMQFADGWLWYTTTGAIYKSRDKNGDGKSDEDVTVIAEGNLPRGGGHWWRPILVTQDAIYTGIGDNGNISEAKNEREKLFRFDKQGGNKTLWSTGIRNTEKLRLRPGTNEIYGADHGSDNFGGPLGERGGANQPVTNLNPPCEFNRYVQDGFYGHPYVPGYGVPRYEYKDRPDILELVAKTILPEWNFGAHWAPNGFTFLTKNGLGDDLKGDALVAMHGSWNSTVKVGYRIERVMFDKALGRPIGGQPMVMTITQEGNVLARPVDCVELADGSVLFSCDATGKIFRIRKS
ncbi:MAG: PQQ-dependent sugar dehydrogenase [Armatimonadetes bacterium]|nr:PQQ-dependent sugar dehydrogenase [Armatimonadota bacterium]